MSLSPAADLIFPQNEEQQKLTDYIHTLVAAHFDFLYRKTSPAMRALLKKLVVRVVWDSRTQDKYGEFYGVPVPHQTPYDTGMLPPDAVLFARPLIENYAGDELVNKVHKVLVHEIGHYLGLSEATLRKRGIY